MIIIDNSNQLKKSLEAYGLDLHEPFQNAQIYTIEDFTKLEIKKRNDFILVDTVSVMSHRDQDEFFIKLNTFHGAFFFHEHKNQNAQTWLESQSGFLKKILGEWCLPMTNHQAQILSNQLQFFWQLIDEQKNLQLKLFDFSKEIEKIFESAETEIERAKKLHETLVPKREQEIKGIHFSHKSSSGQGLSAEFYDLIQQNQKAFHVLLSTSSYLVSSTVIGLLSQYREKHFTPEQFLIEANQDIKKIAESKKKPIEVELVIIEVDFSAMTMSTHGTDKVEIFSSVNKRVVLNTEKKYELTKGDKIIILSPGFSYNWRSHLPHIGIYDFLKNIWQKSSDEIMNDLYMELKGQEISYSQEKDSSIIMMEVNRHGIYKV